MTTTDWIVDIALVLIVLRQLREEKFSVRFVLIPLGLVAYTAHLYLTSLPTGGNDLLLVGAALGLGLLLGAAGGLTTLVRGEAGSAYVRAGATAATIWVASMTARLAFIVWITHGGSGALARFSVAHDITSGDAWQTALVLLALSEVISRIGIIVVRARTAARLSATPAGRTLLPA